MRVGTTNAQRKRIQVSVEHVEEAFRSYSEDQGIVNLEAAWNMFWRRLNLVRKRDQKREMRASDALKLRRDV